MKQFTRNEMFFGLAVFLMLQPAGGASAQEWTRFRGPNGSGVSDAKSVPMKWTETDYNWKVKLPGEGISSPVVWCEKVFVSAAEPDRGERHLLCIDAASGKELWRRSQKFEVYKKHKVNSYATSTPAVDEERVYHIWQSREESVLLAFRHDGTPAWTFPLDPFSEGHGGGVSPIVWRDVIFGTCGFVTSDKHCVAVRPSDIGGKSEAKELFRVEKTAPHLPTPIVYKDRLFLWTEKGIVSTVRLESGAVVTTKRVGGNYSASPICIDGKLYAVSDDGEVVVLQADDDLVELARNTLDEPSRATPAVSGGRLYLRTMGQLISLDGRR